MKKFILILNFLFLSTAFAAPPPIVWGSPFSKILQPGLTFTGTDTATTCTAATAGGIRYNAGTFESCNGSAWSSMGGGSVVHGGVFWAKVSGGTFFTTACSSGACTINYQSSTTGNTSWLTSVTWNSTGKYALVFAGGVFTSTPVCTCSAINNGVAYQQCFQGDATAPPTSTALAGAGRVGEVLRISGFWKF